MHKRLNIGVVVMAIFISYSLLTHDADAATINASSCSMTDVSQAYNAATDGDTVIVPSGNCTWSSTLFIQKEVSIKGQGIGLTVIRLGSSVSAMSIQAGMVRLSGFTFDCNNLEPYYKHMITVGWNDGGGCDGGYNIANWRIDSNKFTNCGPSDTLGKGAISVFGAGYGLIDSNTFDNCGGECIEINSDGYLSRLRSSDPGQYSSSKTIYIEDNTFNYTGSFQNDNVVEGTSGSRYVFRYNTVNSSDTSYIAGVVGTHDCSGSDNCSPSTQEDMDAVLVEMYGNTINNNSNNIDYLLHHRSGRAFVYNNTVYYNNVSVAWLYHLRSKHRVPSCGIYKSGERNLADYCHEGAGEGISLAKTTINGGINNVQTTGIVMASVADFPTYGGSIIIGTEQVDYTGLNGNELTGVTRGANNTTPASHVSASNVDLLIFGQCDEQPNNSYYWGNVFKQTPESAGVPIASVNIGTGDALPNYEEYDMVSYAQRPNNWQYRIGTAYSYVPYPYPHPLRTGISIPSAPSNLRRLLQ